MAIIMKGMFERRSKRRDRVNLYICNNLMVGEWSIQARCGTIQNITAGNASSGADTAPKNDLSRPTIP
jgi:hypothetical protein